MKRRTLIKCKHCKLGFEVHMGPKLSCPIGKRHRTLGYTQCHKSNTFEPIFRHGYLCDKCAVGAGMKWPKGHCATAHHNECPYCRKPESLCAVTDWLKPNQKTMNPWDWD